jgi:hypothetical protein
MQHTQFNVVRHIAMVILLSAALPADAGTMAKPSKPDPLLDGGPTAPCAAGADYAGGADVNGRPVVPADIASRPVPVPNEIMVPVGGTGQARGGRSSVNSATSAGNGAFVGLDGKKLDPLLNPKPCH